MDSKTTTISQIEKITLPKVYREEGSITAINAGVDVPFDIKRVFYTYDVPGGQDRGGHGHYTLHELIVAGSGSFDVLLDDGKDKKVISLNRPYEGVILIPGIWMQLINFSSGAVALTIASQLYDPGDYMRDYDEFVKYKDWS